MADIICDHAITNNLGSSVGWGEKNFHYADRQSDINDDEHTMTIYYMGSRAGTVNKFIRENSIYLEKDKHKGWLYMGIVTEAKKQTQFREKDPIVYKLTVDVSHVINGIVPGTLLVAPNSKSKCTALMKLGYNTGRIPGQSKKTKTGSPMNGAFAIYKVA